jgi:phosphonate transport system substrate-binding protein
MKRLPLLVTLLAVLAGSGCDRTAESGQGGGDRPAIDFSILSTENSQNQAEQWGPFLADMEAQTGLEIRPFFGPSYFALIEAMRGGQTEVGWFSNNSGLQAVRRANAEVFVRSSDPSGVDGYRSVVIVRTDSRLTARDLLRCDRTLDFGLGDAVSTSGTLAPITYLFAPRNIDPRECFKAVRSANHEANIRSVANGTLDAATNNSTNLGLLKERQPELAGRVKVIWESPLIPEDPIVWRRDLDPAIKEKVRQFFLTYGTAPGPEGDRQRKILASLSFGAFRPANNTHLLPVREMEATSNLLQARNAGDTAKAREAEAALSAIRAERAELEARVGAPPAN